MKTKRKPVASIRSADDSELSEKALDRTNTDRYRDDEKSTKRNGNDNYGDKCVYYNNNANNHDNGNDEENNIVPLEIDTHFQMFRKHMWDVEYGERCPLCNKRIDEYGFCACGSGGE